MQWHSYILKCFLRDQYSFIILYYIILDYIIFYLVQGNDKSQSLCLYVLVQYMCIILLYIEKYLKFL